jgi:transmembrane sensor
MQDYSSFTAADLLLDDQFIQYCNGDTAVASYWSNLAENNLPLQEEIKIAMALYQNLTIATSTEEKQTELTNLKKNIEAEKEKPTVLTPLSLVRSITSNKKWRIAIAAAAVLTGIIFTTTVLLKNNQHYNINNIAANEFAKAHYNQVIQSSTDERKEVMLPDGSTVTLNCGTSIKISDDFNKTQRWVYLDGEAFFSVKPDKERPFVVITKKTATSALGTSFKIRSYAGETQNTVMLATGKVKVQSIHDNNASSDIYLLPGQKATTENNNLPIKANFDMEALQNWRSLTIELNKANLNEIIDALEFYYGVHVTLINKPQTEIAFTGKFSKESLHDLMEAISYTNKFNYTQKGNTVSILFQ